MNRNIFICDDSLNYIKSLEDNCIDLIVTDPPYELNESNPGDNNVGMSRQKYFSEQYKSICNGFNEHSYFGEFQRVLKKINLFIFCSNKQISKLMSYWEERDCIVTLLTWDKPNAVPFANGTWRSNLEFIVHARERGATFQGGYNLKSKSDTIPIITNKKYDHPTVKPLKLFEKYIQIGSNEGDVILDPFCGSGTAAIACYNYKRDFICIDYEKKYIEMSQDRYKKHISGSQKMRKIFK